MVTAESGCSDQNKGGGGGTLELNALYPYNVKWWKYQGQHENAPRFP